MIKAPDSANALWQQTAMPNMSSSPLEIAEKLIDELYLEAMVLADEARSYLELWGMRDRDDVQPLTRIQLSCESLKVTTRLMQVIAWLLTRRALARGEIDAAEAASEKYRLGDAAPTDHRTTIGFPSDMRVLIAASESLYQRALRLEEQLVGGIQDDRGAASSPARDLMHRLESAF